MEKILLSISDKAYLLGLDLFYLTVGLATYRARWVCGARYWWPQRSHMSWEPCCPCWHSPHTVPPPLPRCVYVKWRASSQFKGTLSGESWVSFPHSVFHSNAEPPFLVCTGTTSWRRFPLHAGKSYFSACSIHMEEIVQEPWPFSIPIFGDWLATEKPEE